MTEFELRDLLLSKIDKYLPEAIALSDAMAREPELGSHEFKSSTAHVALLRKYGIEVECPFAGFETAFKGVINPDKPRRFALLAEYDALPGYGPNGDEPAHACGHCASGAASTLAALIFNEVKDELDFGVDIIGTPDEEWNGDKAYMADAGVFDNYDYAVMVHMGGETLVDTTYLALDGLNFIWRGVAAHAAASPQEGRNAMNAARLFLDATDMMRQHVEDSVRMHGYIKKAGVASNVVPDYAEIEFLTRAPSRNYLNYVTEWVRDCARAAAMMTKTEVELGLAGPPFHDLHALKSGHEMVKSCMDELGLEYGEPEESTSGSSDIGNVDYVCPAFHPIMGLGDANLVAHTQEFADKMLTEDAHQAIKDSARLMLAMAAKMYSNPEILNAIKAEHKEYRGY